MTKTRPEKEPLPSEQQSLDRIAKLLAHIITKGETQRAQVLTLSRLGFSNAELASLLGASNDTIRQAKSQGLKAPKKRKLTS